jgi:hypothetical protein
MMPLQNDLGELGYMSKSIVNVLEIEILLGEGDTLPIRVIEDSR